MNNYLKLLLIVVVAVAFFAPPIISDSSFAPQAVAAQGGDGGGIRPPFPFGMSRGGDLILGRRRNRSNMFTTTILQHP